MSKPKIAHRPAKAKRTAEREPDRIETLARRATAKTIKLIVDIERSRTPGIYAAPDQKAAAVLSDLLWIVDEFERRNAGGAS